MIGSNLNPSLLLLVGLSSSINLGERPPGIVVQGMFQTSSIVAQVAFDSIPKQNGGWTLRQSIDGVKNKVNIGGEYIRRDGGDWTKNTAWLRAGWRSNNLAVILRMRVLGAKPNSGAIHLEYWRNIGRFVFSTQHGILAYSQPTLQAGYYCTVSIGKERRH